MADPRFFVTRAPLTAAAAARLAGGEVAAGPKTAAADRASALDAHDLGGSVVFIESETAAAQLVARRSEGGLAAGAPSLLVTTAALCGSLSDVAGDRNETAIIVCDTPKSGFALICDALHESRADAPDLAYASPEEFDGDVGSDARIDASVRIAPGASIGAGAILRPNVVIGPGVVIGDGARIEVGAAVSHAYIGESAVIGANAVIGGAGFGIVEIGGRPARMPQVGLVRIGARVEIGDATTVDRATLGETAIGDDTKIDNLVQVAHNVRIGRACVIAAYVGLAGSATIGDGVMIGGNSGVGNNVRIGDGARLGSMSGFMRDVPAGESWGGTPAMPTHLWWRMILFMQRAAKPKKKEANGD